MKVFAGCVSERLPFEKYAKALPFVELALRTPLPKLNKLRSWRQSMPNDLKVSVVIPTGCYCTKEEVFASKQIASEEVTWLVEAATSTQANFLIFVTPAKFGPGVQDRQRMKAFVDDLKTKVDAKLVWEPKGMWEIEAAAEFAKELDIIVAVDLLGKDKAPRSNTMYIREHAMGLRQRFGDSAIYDIIENLYEAKPEEAYIALDSDRSFDEAKNFLKVLSSF